MKKLTYTLLTLPALCYACNATADPNIRFNGFASVYAGMTTDDDETLYGFDDSVDFRPASVFGIQATSNLGEGLSATAQILARGIDDFDAQFEWAYLTYSLNDEMDISAGRMRLPLFKYSEYLDVGYAFTWARTPQDVYGISFNNFEGLRFNYTTTAGAWDLAWQAVYGSSETDLNISGQNIPSDLESILGVSLDATYDWLSLRLGYTIADTTIDAGVESLAPLFTNLQAFDDLQADEDSSYFVSAGAFIDYNDWLVNAEVIQFESEDNFAPKTDAFYVMLGRRFDSITVAYTYSEADESNEYDVIDSIPGVIPTPDPGREAICGSTARDFVANCVIAAENENSTHNIAVRWDFHPSAALTVDYTNREFDLRNNAASDQSDKLLSVGIDLVF